MMPQVARHIVAGSRALGFALLWRSSEVTTHRIAELYIRLTLLAPISFYSTNPSVFQLTLSLTYTHTLTHIYSVSLIPGFSDTRRIPHAGVPSISIKDTLPHQTAWLVATEVANGCKAIFTLALIDSLSCDRPTVYVPRGHYFRFNGAATCGREKKKER